MLHCTKETRRSGGLPEEESALEEFPRQEGKEIVAVDAEKPLLNLAAGREREEKGAIWRSLS